MKKKPVWKWKYLKDLSRKEIDDILCEAAKIAKKEYEDNKDLDFSDIICRRCYEKENQSNKNKKET